MKSVQEVNCCVVDYGTFLSLGQKLSETYGKVRYYCPHQDEYRDAQKCVIGDGMPGLEWVDDFMDPDIVKETDLFVFPDIGFGGHQRFLRSIGKRVWGSNGSDELELLRTRFLKVLKDVGLPVVPSVKVVGVTALADHLKQVENKWVKVNTFRANMETWHHYTWEHSIAKLRELAADFGGIAEHVIFVVQDDIPDAKEIGYDGYCVDNQFPDRSMQGYEKKNQLYLGSVLPAKRLPEAVQIVNEKYGPVLAEYGHRNFFASEIRQTEDNFWFIDPTDRMAGQTQEQMLESCRNLPEIIWKGSAGELVNPDFEYTHAAEATLHHTGDCEGWKALSVPETAARWTKLYHCCFNDGYYHFPPGKNKEVGVIIGLGNNPEEAMDALRENFEHYEDQPVKIEFEGFADLLQTIQEAEAAGIEFTDEPVPEPETVLKG